MITINICIQYGRSVAAKNSLIAYRFHQHRETTTKYSILYLFIPFHSVHDVRFICIFIYLKKSEPSK